jgi:hypothetical protein
MADLGFVITFIGMEPFAERLKRRGLHSIPLPTRPVAMDPVLFAQRSEQR